MNDSDIIQAKEEAIKFVQFVKDLQKAVNERDGFLSSFPVEVGLVRAQSLILSRALSAMRNPYCQRNERKRK